MMVISDDSERIPEYKSLNQKIFQFTVIPMRCYDSLTKVTIDTPEATLKIWMVDFAIQVQSLPENPLQNF